MTSWMKSIVLAAGLCLGLLPGPAAADPTITFRYTSYTPSSVRIEPGQSVTWRGDPGSTFDALSGHPLQFSDPAIPGQADASGSTTRTFTRIGRFSFSCRLHVQFNMAGAVLVSANHPPAPHLSAPSSAAVGAPVTLDASGSSDADPGQTLSYAWDVDGDGEVDQSGPVVTTTYAEAGTYAVRLIVTDSNAEPGIGAESSSTTRSITVGGSSGSGSGKSGGTAGGQALGAGQPTAGDPDAVVLRVAAGARVLTRGLAVRVSNPEAATATATLRYAGRVIGSARTSLRARGTKTMRIRLTRRGRALLKRKRHLRVELRVVLDDADSTGTTARRFITLRR